MLGRARAYARSRGVKLAVVEGSHTARYLTVRVGATTLLILDSATAFGPHCGDVVYRACETIDASRALAINVHVPVCRLRASEPFPMYRQCIELRYFVRL
jgi:bacterioferritin-associated ferredoxin